MYDLEPIELQLLEHIAKADNAMKVLNVVELLSLNELASKATIHRALKKLLGAKLIALKKSGVGSKIKDVVLTPLAHKHLEDLNRTLEK